MKRFSFLALVLLSGTAFGMEPILQSGKWDCQVKGKTGGYFRPKTDYQLEIETNSKAERSLVLALGKSEAHATENTLGFNVKSGKLLSDPATIQINCGEPGSDCTDLEMVVSIRRAKTNKNIGFACKSTSAPKMITLTSQDFVCDTELVTNGRNHRVEFTVAGLGTPYAQIEGDAEIVIKSTPADSPLASLNENMSTSEDAKEFSIHGDSDGLTLVDLGLYVDQDYKKGYYRVTDKTGGKDHGYGKVDCKVTKR